MGARMDVVGGRNRGRRAAYTLLELLIILTIIAILSALLLPMLQSAVANARSTTCLNNQKAILQADMTYADQYRGHINGPANWLRWSGGTFMSWYRWLNGGQTDITPKYILPDVYLANRNVFVCPSYTPDQFNNDYRTYGKLSGGTFAGQSSLEFISIESLTVSSGAKANKYFRIASVHSPSQVPLFADTLYGDWDTQYYYFSSNIVVTSTSNGWGVHARHGGLANIGYFDGHAASESGPRLQERGFLNAWSQDRILIPFQ